MIVLDESFLKYCPAAGFRFFKPKERRHIVLAKVVEPVMFHKPVSQVFRQAYVPNTSRRVYR